MPFKVADVVLTFEAALVITIGSCWGQSVVKFHVTDQSPMSQLFIALTLQE